MVPKTPGEKPPGPTLSQAQAGGVRGGALAFGKIFRIVRVELLEKTFGEEVHRG